MTKIKSKLYFIMDSLDEYSIFQLLLNRLYSVTYYLVIKINLKFLTEFPLKRTPPGELSLLTSDDLIFIKQNIKSYGQSDRKEILARIQFYEQGFRHCYIVKVNNKIAYLQWLIYASENHLIRKYYPKIFFPVKENQVIIENAYTFPEFRGMGYLPYVSRLLLKKAQDKDCYSAIGYIKIHKIASLNEFYQMGFKTIRLLKEIKLIGFKHRNL